MRSSIENIFKLDHCLIIVILTHICPQIWQPYSFMLHNLPFTINASVLKWLDLHPINYSKIRFKCLKNKISFLGCSCSCGRRKKITKSRRKLRQCRNFLHILISAEMPKFSFGLHAKNRLRCMPQQPGTKTVDLFTKSQISTGKCSKCRLHILAWTTTTQILCVCARGYICTVQEDIMCVNQI